MNTLFENQRTRTVPKGKVLIYEGDEIKKLYFLVSGFVKVYAVINSGAQRIIYLYKPGEVFPLTTYLSGTQVARFFYESMTPLEVRTLSSRQFEKKVEGDLRVGEVLIRYTNLIDSQFYKRVRDIVSPDTPLQKVIKVLYFLMEKVGKGRDQVHIDFPFALKDLGSMCGLSREEVSAQLVYLKDRGVTYSSNSFVVDKKKLKSLSRKT